MNAEFLFMVVFTHNFFFVSLVTQKLHFLGTNNGIFLYLFFLQQAVPFNF